MKSNRGFTLMELMVVIGIIGILAVIAVPAYSDYSRKARRADAKVALTTLAQAQETYHADYPRYASVLGANTNYASGNILGCRTGCFIESSVAYSPDKHYVVSINAGNASRFVITAQARTGSAQEQDTKCLGFALDSLGRKASGSSASDAVAKLSQKPSDPNDCWN